MKERGIIFNGEMVRAILDGRKAQTRRIISPQPELTERSGFSWKGALFGAGSDDRETNRNFAHCRCPLGKVGDRLWVRETCYATRSTPHGIRAVAYPADNEIKIIEYADQHIEKWGTLFHYRNGDGQKVPSIHMPRWASRITLEITDIRVERNGEQWEWIVDFKRVEAAC
ncbi:hypothetical protein [Rosenbergiella metrosideri]|uniref:hypothetical protein n=1 Tax=Rosenbergiella metrosideri TaxID=2921185 RepID=UPI003BAA7D0F